MWIIASADAVQPAVEVGLGAELDAGQVGTQFAGLGAGGAVADHQLQVGRLDPDDRADHRRGAAGQCLGDHSRFDAGAQLGEPEWTLDRAQFAAALQRQFELADRRRNGVLDFDEAKAAGVRSKRLFRAADANDDARLDFGEYLDAMQRGLR